MISPALFVIALFVLWEVLCKALDVPLTILPAPSDVFGALWQYRKPIWDNSFVTLWTTLGPSAPFLVGGVVKIAYDLTLWWLFRLVKPPEEASES